VPCPVIVICPFNTPAAKPLGFTDTTTLPGVCPDPGLTDSQLPPDALAVKLAAEPLVNTEMLCGVGAPLPTGTLKLNVFGDTVNAAAVLIVKLTAPVVPPGVVTVTLNVPTLALEPIANVAEICCALTTFTLLTVTPGLLTFTVAPETKLVPVSATGTLTPGAPLFGLMEVSVGGAGPLDTTRFTVDPALIDVPAAGLSLITLPDGTVLLAAVVTVPTTKPAFVIAVAAAACVIPTTFGTVKDAGPLDTTRFTADPALTDVPATGLSLTTLPDGTVLLAAVVTVPTTNPAFVSAVVAAACVEPTTFGTVTDAGPLDTTRFTADPALTDVPATGLSLITLPDATVLLAAVVTVPTTKPAFVSAVVAAACVDPTTFGTVVPFGAAEETVNVCALLVPLEVVTLTLTGPGVAFEAMISATVICVELNTFPPFTARPAPTFGTVP